LAVNFYEGMFILDASRYAQDPNGVSGQVNEMIEAAGGDILVSRLWEERRLAYPIEGHRKGAYWLSYFKVEGSAITELERKCQLNATVVRVLFVKVDPRIIDTLVEHAKTGHFHPQTEEETPSGKESEGPERPKADSREKTAETETSAAES
jgi:small subunit ribosomal protein S6